MMRIFKAKYFDGKRPVSAEGFFFVTKGALHFVRTEDEKKFVFSFNKILDCRRENGRVVITLSHSQLNGPAAHREIVSNDLSAYDEIIPYIGRRLRPFGGWRSKKAAVFILAASGMFALIFWGLLTQSYRFVPHNAEKKIGEKVIESLQTFSVEYNDNIQKKRIRKIIERIRPSDSPFTYDVRFVDNPQVNAFAVPGGGILIFKGLLDKKLDNDQLAGILAHEISHVEFRHGLRQMIRYLGISFLFQIAGVAGLDQVQWVSAVNDISSLILIFKYSRGYETDADSNAVKLTIKAGYNPDGLVRFLQNMGEGAEPPEYLSTHPSTKGRIENIKKLIRNNK